MSILTNRIVLALTLACAGVYIQSKQVIGYALFLLGWEIAKTGGHIGFVHFNFTLTCPVLLSFLIVHHLVKGNRAKILFFLLILPISLVLWNLLGLYLIEFSITEMGVDVTHVSSLLGVLDPIGDSVGPAVSVVAIIIAVIALAKKAVGG